MSLVNGKLGKKSSQLLIIMLDDSHINFMPNKIMKDYLKAKGSMVDDNSISMINLFFNIKKPPNFLNGFHNIERCFILFS